MAVSVNISSNTPPPVNQRKKGLTGNTAFFLNKNISFKGGIPNVPKVITVDDALDILEKEIGKSAKKHFKQIIDNLTSKEGSGVKKLATGELEFDKDTVGKNLYRAFVDPVIHFPVDSAISTLNFCKKIPGLKNAKFIDKGLNAPNLKRRSTDLETFSNAMAVKHCFEMLGDEKAAKGDILREALRRCKNGVSPYTVKGERSLTRIVSGIIPAFFLANDAYNLSMYMNNDKQTAQKEKKRRFYQEIARVAVTAGATFGALGYFSKKVSSNPAMAAGIIAGLTFVSEFIGRILVGTPVYPISQDEAKKYAKLQNKDKSTSMPPTPTLPLEGGGSSSQSRSGIPARQQEARQQEAGNKKDKPKSHYVMKLIGGLVLAGFLIDKHQSIKPLRKIVNNLTSKYKEFFVKDYKISREKFDEIIKKLRKNGFDGIADDYERKLNKILDAGNLTTKEKLKIEREINNKAEKFMPDKIIWSDKELKKALEEAKKKSMNYEDLINDLNITTKSNDIIYINGDLAKFFKERTNVDKTKDNIINGVLALPIKFALEIVNIPYKYVVKPLIEIPFNLIKEGKFIKVKNETTTDDELFRKNVEYLHKNIKAPDFKEKVNKNIIDAFDNVNKSNISSAELAGSAKVAVSTATSGFLILDNYNMVMIDSEGENKDLAGQKAKERTIQRIIRIAYGACLIKLFNGLFKSQYHASLVGAEAVTAGNVLITETLERTSVGMPLHEATREEIIAKDNEALNATGLKGAYFRFMSKLTGKKPLSQKNIN